MSASTYEDRSYAPIGTSLIYRRGDGATVNLSITADGKQPATPLPMIASEPALLPAPGARVVRHRPRFDLFDETPAAPSPVASPPPTPLLPLGAPALQLAPGHTLEAKKAGTVMGPHDDPIFDHQLIGGKFTIFVLFYGPPQYHQLHRKCLDSIISTVPQHRLDLRVGSNELCPESVKYIESHVQSGLIRKHYRHIENAKKYPVMREMFWDSNMPIETKWLLWFDDDSIADRNNDWLRILANAMVAHPDSAMFGSKMYFPLDNAQIATYRQRPWFTNKPLRNKNGHPSPNGNCAHFATGGMWALRTDAMRACQIPDPLLAHNGGDYTIGEQLYQGGFNMKSWNGQKQYVHTSSVPRRGLSETHFGKR